ncbi:uncharacterized protein LOC726039 isoform X2 [Apis mellifera]|uniref:Uncharacterized protein LOC726039 isoform X2 n=1 Tax=Apis mellifera TaxID=7460 RepID=A0A7M7M5B4_APIME|nr:uncharacterized protein LOC726039 isoform X2 [Apis mellifera]|eukprot:XP_016770985.1 uncharacterized protein LOC726039 isoform X2 [Apis mellifera]
MDPRLFWIVCFGLIAILVSKGWAIDCFKCVSIDGDNKPCDDPFHNNGSLAFLESPCLGGRKGRDGLFPATACIKIAGIYDESGISLTVRSCALDSGTLTTDSEIIRMSHCGGFYFDDNWHEVVTIERKKERKKKKRKISGYICSRLCTIMQRCRRL